ncbi:hypothetical protein [Nonomuraea sp. NPDC052265]|uniref:hypothetical protein n=1 Tax=Nonomuraea sp. NPDC052265 TaxID=3364374 RepID=UPI0037CBC1C8
MDTALITCSACLAVKPARVSAAARSTMPRVPGVATGLIATTGMSAGCRSSSALIDSGETGRLSTPSRDVLPREGEC